MDAEQIVATPTPEALLDGVEPAGWMYEHSAPGVWPQIAVKRLRDSFGSNWTETPLYTRAQVLAAVEADRAAIVAWLREQGNAGNRALFSAVEGSQLRRDLAAGVVSINRAANAIEASAYLPTPPSQDTQP